MAEQRDAYSTQAPSCESSCFAALTCFLLLPITTPYSQALPVASSSAEWARCRASTTQRKQSCVRRDGVMDAAGPKPCAAVQGTTLLVEDLFYNSLTRKKVGPASALSSRLACLRCASHSFQPLLHPAHTHTHTRTHTHTPRACAGLPLAARRTPQSLVWWDPLTNIATEHRTHAPDTLQALKASGEEYGRILELLGRYAVFKSGVAFSCKKQVHLCCASTQRTVQCTSEGLSTCSLCSRGFKQVLRSGCCAGRGYARCAHICCCQQAGQHQARCPKLVPPYGSCAAQLVTTGMHALMLLVKLQAFHPASCT